MPARAQELTVTNPGQPIAATIVPATPSHVAQQPLPQLATAGDIEITITPAAA